MFVEIDGSGYQYQNDKYMVNINHIICLIPRESETEIMIFEMEENLKTKENYEDLLVKINGLL
jgi:hypothetical protein